MSTTNLHLEFPDFNERYFDSIEINSKIMEIKSSSENIIIENSMNREHFYEEIKLSNKIEYVKYKLDLYNNTNNNFYCLISSKNDCSLQIYDYDKKDLLEGINVKQKNTTYNLTLCDRGGLKCCKRFNIINCTKDCLDGNEFINKAKIDISNYIKEGNYIINRFHKEISVQKMEAPIYHEIDFTSLSVEVKKYLTNLESDFSKIYNSLANNEEINFKEKNSKLYDKLGDFVKVGYDFKDLNNLNKILARRRKLAYNKNEYDICYGYAFLQILKAFKNSYSPYALYTMLLYYLNDLKQKIPNSYDILRFMLWYNGNYFKNEDFKDYINDKCNYDFNQNDGKLIEKLNGFSLVFPNSCKRNTPYKISYDFLYKFIDELSEDSYLLEILYLLDSDTASNRIFKNVRTFQLSLLSLSQIKEHLKFIIPEVVIRRFHSQSDWCNAIYDIAYGTLECFEGTLYDKDADFLKSNLIENEDTKYEYSLPLIMVFFHELFGYAKHRLDNNYSFSPTHFYNPYANYKLLYHCLNGESGRILEFYISNDIEIIKYLKFALFPNVELMDVKLWVASDLNELRQIVKQKIKDNNFSCKKKIKYFPDSKNNTEPIQATEDDEDNYLSDQSNFSKGIYDSDENDLRYPYGHLFPENTKICCI